MWHSGVPTAVLIRAYTYRLGMYCIKCMQCAVQVVAGHFGVFKDLQLHIMLVAWEVSVHNRHCGFWEQSSCDIRYYTSAAHTYVRNT